MPGEGQRGEVRLTLLDHKGERYVAFIMAQNHWQGSMWWPPKEMLCFLGDLISIITGCVHYDDVEG